MYLLKFFFYKQRIQALYLTFLTSNIYNLLAETVTIILLESL